MTLLYLAAAWVAGVAFAGVADPPWQLFPALGFLATLGLLLWWDGRYARLASASLLMMALGGGRFLLATPSFNSRSLAAYNGADWVTLEGVVVREPEERDTYTNLRVRAERLALPDGTVRAVKGLVLVKTKRYPRRNYGDRLRISGLLETPPTNEAFSYREYLARRGIYSLMERAHVEFIAEDHGTRPLLFLFALRRRAETVIAEMLPEPQAALLSGILLGVETGIPEEVLKDFRVTGTFHIIAISGFNMTIVSGVFAGLAGRFLHRRWALLVAMVGVALYTVLVGASTAVVRAALMGVLYLLGRYVGRESYSPISLAAAALFITAWNPHALWDSGFLLSFAATAGLLLYAEPFERSLARCLTVVTSAERAQQVVGAVSEGVLVTTAAQIMTMPIILSYSGQRSPIALVSNMLIAPAQTYVMLIGGLATIIGLVLPPLGRIVGWVSWLFLTYTIEVVRLTAALPIRSLPLEMDGWMVWGYYAVLSLFTWWLAKPRDRRRELLGRLKKWLSSGLESKALVGAAGVLLALAFFAWRERPDGRLHVHVLDVGQGDAIFVRTPSGRQVLVDGGPSPSLLLSRLGQRMPFWDRSLDLVVLTHPDADHITGLVEVLERYRVDGVVYREMGCQEAVCARWDQLLEEDDVTVYRGEAGSYIGLDHGLEMEVLHPGPDLLIGEGFNDNSLVMRLRYGEVSILLTGDIEARAEERLLTDGVDLRSTVLKVAHHGACTSSTAAFLEAVDPEAAVISVGEDNDFDHPCDEVLERLRERTVYRTDEHGTVELITDGVRLWVETGW